MDLSPSIKKDVIKELQNECSLATIPKVKFQLIYSDDRNIYKITIKGVEQFYILKVRGSAATKQDDLDEDSLIDEYSKLETAWNYASNLPAGISMSKPIKVWVVYRAILLSGCEGENLNDFFNQNIFKWVFNSTAFQKRLALSGIWLGHYHKLAGQRLNIKPFIVNRLSHVKRMLDNIAQSDNTGMTKIQIANISNKLTQRFNSCEQEMIGSIHGNFAYRNILCGDNELNLVDFEDAREDILTYDCGQYVAEILFKSYLPWLRHQLNSFVAAFIHSYKQSVKFNQNTLDAFIAYHLLVHLYEHSARRKPSLLLSILLKYRMNYLKALLVRWASKNENYLI